jgi:hypothetical protein
MPTSSRLKRAVLRGKTTCLDLRCYGRKRRKPAWRGLPKVSPRRAYQGLFLAFGGEGGHSGFVSSPITSEYPRSIPSIADGPQVAD